LESEHIMGRDLAFSSGVKVCGHKASASMIKYRPTMFTLGIPHLILTEIGDIPPEMGSEIKTKY
jgi:hypothetical protein